jgi:serine/threonine protein kinase
VENGGATATAKGVSIQSDTRTARFLLHTSNLAVTADCHLKILDFGLARLSAHSDPEATQTGAEIGPQAGTLPYMAPEQLDGQPADERSDIYAAGAVLYEMSTGQRLFPDKHGTRLMDAICHCPVRPPRDLNNQISRDLQDFIQKAIDKDPDRRYQSAKELYTTSFCLLGIIGGRLLLCFLLCLGLGCWRWGLRVDSRLLLARRFAVRRELGYFVKCAGGQQHLTKELDRFRLSDGLQNSSEWRKWENQLTFLWPADSPVRFIALLLTSIQRRCHRNSRASRRSTEARCRCSPSCRGRAFR